MCDVTRELIEEVIGFLSVSDWLDKELPEWQELDRLAAELALHILSEGESRDLEVVLVVRPVVTSPADSATGASERVLAQLATSTLLDEVRAYREEEEAEEE